MGIPSERKLSHKVVFRGPRPGDMGRIIHRHGALYYEEYGWDEQFEALVAEIAAKFVQHFDADRERCWIAELDRRFAGCIFLVKESNNVAKLRMFLVEPFARGKGIGKALVSECVGFAREAGYSSVTLWTVDVLTAARHIYEQAGFSLMEEEKSHSFGHDLVNQYWELKL